jgi:Ser/Thr protein kinase RdoA (MazF antagonist)
MLRFDACSCRDVLQPPRHKRGLGSSRQRVKTMRLKKWRQIADRIKKMEGAELRFRLRQELNKRQDRLRSTLRADFASGTRLPGDAKRGNFFFGPEGKIKTFAAAIP